jgi:hypothetical protein
VNLLLNSPKKGGGRTADPSSVKDLSPESVIQISSSSPTAEASSSSQVGEQSSSVEFAQRSVTVVPTSANTGNDASKINPGTSISGSTLLVNVVSKGANTSYKNVLSKNKANGDSRQRADTVDNDGPSLVIDHPSSKQLIYLKIKPVSFSPDNFWTFKDHGPIQKELLMQLAKIPLVAQSRAFSPESLQFALAKHYSHLQGRKTKGHYFTAGFTITSDIRCDIPKLILKAQALQEKRFFTFNLTASSQKETSAIKTRVTFATSIEELADIFQLEFQVRVPLVQSQLPQRDFATLVVEILFPSKDAAKHKLTPRQRLLEIERIESFCNPIKHTSSEHGVIINRLMTGKFPLNLEDADGQDAATCMRLVFSALYGLDLRPRHQERYVLFLPILADSAQLDRTPGVFRSAVATLKESFSKSGIAPAKSLNKKTVDTTSTSESEPEELFVARVEARALALELLPEIRFTHDLESLEFPNLDKELMRPLNISTPGCLVTSPKEPTSHPMLPILLKHEEQGIILELMINMLEQIELQLQQSKDHAPPIEIENFAFISPHEQAQPLSQDFAYPYDGSVIFDPSLQKAFPTSEQIQSAFIRRVKGDGDCLFSSFLQATSQMKIGMPPNTSALALRLITLNFLKINVKQYVLPMIAFPDAPLSLTTPEKAIKSQMPKKLIISKDHKRTQCSCSLEELKKGHLCDGTSFGDIIIHGQSPHWYINFDEYYDGMCKVGAYAEELEIAALSALYKVNIAVWVPHRLDHAALACPLRDAAITFESVTHFYYPGAKGLVLLFNSDGRGHYDWLTFADETQDPAFHHVSKTPAALAQANNFEKAAVDPPSANVLKQIITDEEAVPSPLQRQPLTCWLESKIIRLQQEFEASRSTLKFPFSWPLLQKGKHFALLQPLDTALAIIPIKHTTMEAKHSVALDPWSRVFDPSSVNDIANGFLDLLSSSLFMDADRNHLSLLASYLLSRILVLADSFLYHHGNIINLYSIDTLTDLRQAFGKISDALSLLSDLAKRITIKQYKDAFNLQHDTALNRINSMTEIMENCVTIASLPSQSPGKTAAANNSPSPASEDSNVSREVTPQPFEPSPAANSQAQSQESYSSQFLVVCEDLSNQAEKATSLAKDRLRTVTKENATVAKAQLRTLAQDITKFNDFCKKHKTALDKAPQQNMRLERAAAAVQLFTDKISELLVTLASVESSITAITKAPSTPSKSAKKSAPSSTPKALLSPQELAQHRAIASYFEHISTVASKLDLESVSDGMVFLVTSDSHERHIRLLERSQLSDEDLHQAILDERERKGSSAHPFLAEAFEIDREGSSQGSDPGMSQHDSDDAFIKSQDSAFNEAVHPRHILARDNIRQDHYVDKAPEVATLYKIENLPEGWCPTGHKISFIPTARRNKSFLCSCCKVEFKNNTDIFTCHCATYFACSSCLLNRKTCPPPPSCPKIDCLGSCTLRHKPIITKCLAGNHEIERSTRVWMCSKQKCRSIICCNCLSASATVSSAPLIDEPILPSVSEQQKQSVESAVLQNVIDKAATSTLQQSNCDQKAINTNIGDMPDMRSNSDSSDSFKEAELAVRPSSQTHITVQSLPIALHQKPASTAGHIVLESVVVPGTPSSNFDNDEHLQLFLKSLEDPAPQAPLDSATALRSNPASAAQDLTTNDYPSASPPSSCSPILPNRTPGHSAPMRKGGGQ